MCIFKHRNKKSKFVVKKRTPDVTPFIIPRIDSSSKDDGAMAQFVSPMTGRDENDASIANRVSKTDVTTYDAFRGPQSTYEKDREDPYYEFPKYVDPRKKVKEEKNEPVEKVEVKEERIETPIQEEKIEVKETKEPEFFNYSDVEGKDEKQDQTVLDNLFNIQLERKEEPQVKKEVEVKEVIESKPVVKEEKVEVKEEEKPKGRDYSKYKLPSLDLLNDAPKSNYDSTEWNENNMQIINQTLHDFKVDGKVHDYTEGPTFTRYAIQLAPGVYGSKVESLSNDLQRSLAVSSLRIQNPIPGKQYIGIEIPNQNRRMVTLKELINTEEFMSSKDPLLIPVGLDVEGRAKYTNIAKLPHALVAGSSGSGKSVFLTSFITALLYKNTPETLKFFFIDPKQVDLQQFKDIPHLISPIVFDPQEAVNSLRWLLNEMERRFSLFRPIYCNNITSYNEYCEEHPEYKKLPYILIIIDEAGDFMLNCGNEGVEIVTKLIQKCRAAGMNIFFAMQKPVVKLIDGAIKSNASGRFAFRVPTYTDSQIIIDANGAEKLLGNGDMIFSFEGNESRCQGAFVSTKETSRVREFVQSQGDVDYFFIPSDLEKKQTEKKGKARDELFEEVARFVVNENKCSINQITQHFGIGYNRAAEIVSSLEYYQIISENLGTKARECLVLPEEIEDKLERIKNNG